MHPQTRSSGTRGFTLIELAISLMVIGLLIGGVLKGQELIQNARILKMVLDFQAIETATMVFRSTYDALPGDMRNSASRISDCTTANYCVPTSGTQGNSIIEGSIGGSEGAVFWEQMRRTGILGGSPYSGWGGYGHETPFGGYYTRWYTYWPLHTPTSPHIFTYTPIAPQLSILHTNGIGLPPRTAMAFDQKMDDGKPFTGDVQGSGSTATGGTIWTMGPTNCMTANTTNEYNIAATSAFCLVFVASPNANP